MMMYLLRLPIFSIKPGTNHEPLTSACLCEGGRTAR